MSKSIDRRAWFKSSAMMAGALMIGNRVLAEYTNTTLGTVSTWRPPVDKSPWDYTNMKARLTSNENPFGPSSKAQKAMCDVIKDSWMYPSSAKMNCVPRLPKCGMCRKIM